jgi:hypothetical protein
MAVDERVEVDVTMAFAFVFEPGPSAISRGWPHLTTVGYDGHLTTLVPEGNSREPCLGNWTVHMVSEYEYLPLQSARLIYQQQTAAQLVCRNLR